MLTNAHTDWLLYQYSTHLLRSANKFSKTMLTNAHTGWLLYQCSTHLLRSANKLSKTMLTNTTQIDYCTNTQLISLDLQINSLRLLTNAHTGWLLYQCSTHLLRSANKLSKTMLTNAHTDWLLYQYSTHLLRSANKFSKTMLTNAHTGWLLYQCSTHLLRSANKLSKTMLTNTTQIDYCTNTQLISLDLQINSLRLC